MSRMAEFNAECIDALTEAIYNLHTDADLELVPVPPGSTEAEIRARAAEFREAAHTLTRLRAMLAGTHEEV